MSERDPVTVVLALSLTGLFGLLVYVKIGILGVLLVPLVVALFYAFPGDILKSMNKNGVRVALLVMNGLLVGWIPAEYLGNPPLDGPGEARFMVGLILFSFGFASVFTGIYSLWRYYHISSTPTSDVASVDEGTVEVEGEIETAKDTVTAPVSGEECVAYEYEATQHRRIGSGYYRSVVESERDSRPFYVDDGTGRVLVNPEGAEIDTGSRETEQVENGSSKYDRDTTVKEIRVPAEGRVYVFGEAEWSDEHGTIAIRDGGFPFFGAPFFRISDSSESELVDDYRKKAVLSFVTASVGIPVGGWLVLGSSGVF